MRNVIFIMIACVYFMESSGQFYEIKGGINFTGFYKGEKTSDDTYQHKPGYALGISIGDLTSHRLMFSLKIDNIKAYYQNVHQSATGSSTYEVFIDKTNLALDAYFINLRFQKGVCKYAIISEI